MTNFGQKSVPRISIKVSKSILSQCKIITDTGKELTLEILIDQGVRQGCSLLMILINM